MGQQQTILRHLKARGSITTLEAAKLYAVTRLPNRIGELEDRGVKIQRIEHESRHPGAAGNYFEYKYKGMEEI